MKVKIIATQEVVMVEECGYDYTCNSKIFRDKNGNRYLSYDLEFDVKEQTKPTKEIDWEQRRFELVKAALQGVLNAISVERFTIRIKASVVADAAIEYADAVIAKLKENEH